MKQILIAFTFMDGIMEQVIYLSVLVLLSNNVLRNYVSGLLVEIFSLKSSNHFNKKKFQIFDEAFHMIIIS